MNIARMSRIAAIAVGGVLGISGIAVAASPAFDDPAASPLQRRAESILQDTAQARGTIVSLDVPWEPGDTVAAVATAPEPEEEPAVADAVAAGDTGEVVASRSLDARPCGAGGSWPDQVRSMITNLFGITNIGGYRPGDPGDHGSGLALDVMVSNAGQGDSVAQWAVSNMGALNISYVIWQQRINMGGGWSGMEDRGSITANHYDHVHISLHPGYGSCN